MSPTFTFPSAPLALESAIRLVSLSFVLTVSVPALPSTEVTSPVMRVVFASDFISVFFSIAGAGGVAGVAGVAGLAWAKLMPLKGYGNQCKDKNSERVLHSITSSPSLDASILQCFKLKTEKKNKGR